MFTTAKLHIFIYKSKLLGKKHTFYAKFRKKSTKTIY